MNSQSSDRPVSTVSSLAGYRSSRSFPSVRPEFIRMVAPQLHALVEIGRMCDELLAAFDSEWPPEPNPEDESGDNGKG